MRRPFIAPLAVSVKVPAVQMATSGPVVARLVSSSVSVSAFVVPLGPGPCPPLGFVDTASPSCQVRP